MKMVLKLHFVVSSILASLVHLFRSSSVVCLLYPKTRQRLKPGVMHAP